MAKKLVPGVDPELDQDSEIDNPEDENDQGTEDTNDEDDPEDETAERPAAGIPFFEIGMQPDGKWHWMFWGADGRPWATSVRGLNKRIHITNAIRKMQAQIGDTEIKILVASK